MKLALLIEILFLDRKENLKKEQFSQVRLDVGFQVNFIDD